jgi:hypothetical protein
VLLYSNCVSRRSGVPVGATGPMQLSATEPPVLDPAVPAELDPAVPEPDWPAPGFWFTTPVHAMLASVAKSPNAERFLIATFMATFETTPSIL